MRNAYLLLVLVALLLAPALDRSPSRHSVTLTMVSAPPMKISVELKF